MKKLLELASATGHACPPINIRESGFSRACLAWHDPRDVHYYDSDFIFYSLRLVTDWFDKTVLASLPNEATWKAKLFVGLVGSVCREFDAESFAAFAGYQLPRTNYVNLGSPDGPLEESILCLYPNGENKWVGVLEFGEDGDNSSIYIFNVELAFE